MRSPFTQPLALVTRSTSGVDGDGNDTNAETFTIVSGAFAPGGTTETDQGQTQVTDQPTAYLPIGTDVTAVDAIINDPVEDGDSVTGDWYEVAGDPEPWTNPYSGREYGVAVPLNRVTG